MNVPMLFYHPRFNMLRILNPDGTVEVLNMNDHERRKGWFKSTYSGDNYDISLENLSRQHELIGLV